jgi:hypothetical protein
MYFHHTKSIGGMTQAKKQFERVQRAYARVLDNRNRKLAEYEDDVWGFVFNCWHLKDWIKNDNEGVAKATRTKIEAEVNSYPALMMLGELANRSKHLKVMSGVAKAGTTSQAQKTAAGYVHVASSDSAQDSARGVEAIQFLVIDKNGDKFPIKKLATDAMKNWMAIVRKYRI